MRIPGCVEALPFVALASLAFAADGEPGDRSRPLVINPAPEAIPAQLAERTARAVRTPLPGPAPESTVIIVDDNGLGDYLTINPAVAAAAPGDTILVLPGLYVEDVVVDKKVAIIGAGSAANPNIGTVLRGASIAADMTVVTVTGDEVSISDLRVDGSQPVFGRARRGILGVGVDRLSVSDCFVQKAVTGIAYVSSTKGSFLRNEVTRFGKTLQEGGGVYLFDSDGTCDANHVFDGLATAFLYHSGSSGECIGNLAESCPAGYLSNGSGAPTVFRENTAQACEQGFQSAHNLAGFLLYDGNTASDCVFGYAQFGGGAVLHAFFDNKYLAHAEPRSIGFYFTNESPFGDGPLFATCRGNSVLQANVGVMLEETPSSVGFPMGAQWGGAGSPNMLCDNTTYDIQLVGCNDPIDATGNYWCSKDPAAVELKVFHVVDDPTLGFVSFLPLAPVGVPYCAGKQHSGGCIAAIGTAGAGPPSATSTEAFEITAVNVRNNKAGILLTSIAGAGNQPFLGGTLCLGLPLKRQPAILSSGGNPGPADCSGSYAFDMQARIQSLVDPTLLPGNTVYGQWILRDGGVSFGAAWSDAISFVICP